MLLNTKVVFCFYIRTLLEFKMVNSNYFFFSFVIPFSFIVIFWGLRIRVDMTSLSHISHMTWSQSHGKT